MAKSLKITVEQGQQLFLMSANLTLPEKIGNTKYNVAERFEATECARELYRELKSRSPIFLKDRKTAIFGPAEHWKEIKNDNGEVVKYDMKDFDGLVEIATSDDVILGAFYCLINVLHPESRFCASPKEQEEIFWPVARTLGIVAMIKKELGIDVGNKKRRITYDKAPKGKGKGD